MEGYYETYNMKTRHTKNTNKMRSHKPHLVSEKDIAVFDRTTAKKERMFVKNFKRQQAIYKFMHCHPAQQMDYS